MSATEVDGTTRVICNGQAGGQPCPEYGDAATLGLPSALRSTIRSRLKAAGWRVFVPNPQPRNRERLDYCPAHIPPRQNPPPPPVQRPNGKLYQARIGIVAHEISDGDGITTGVLVLGTHDQERAQVLADEVARRVAGPSFAAAGPETGWYHNSVQRGERRWVNDEVHGRAGVLFREIVEA